MQLLQLLKTAGLGRVPGQSAASLEAFWGPAFSGGKGAVTPVVRCFHPNPPPGAWAKVPGVTLADGAASKTFDPLPTSAATIVQGLPDVKIPAMPAGATICYVALQVRGWKEGALGADPAEAEVIVLAVCPPA